MSRLEPSLLLPDGWTLASGAGWRVLADREEDVRSEFAASVVRSLAETPRRLDQRWLYDAHGSAIYEAITATEAYYPTRTEDQILATHAHALLARFPARSVVELGSGSSTKTRRVLEAALAGGPARYVPIDVSTAALTDAAETLAAAYPSLLVEGVASTFAAGLSLAAGLDGKLILFLGSTIGNVPTEAQAGFLGMVRDAMGPGDGFLVGIDLVKDPAVLERAYNDPEGHTARFTGNLVARMNRDLGTAIPEEAVSHEAFYDVDRKRIEIYSRFDRDVHFTVDGQPIHIEAGERVLQEISRKFEVDAFAATAAEAGLRAVEVFTDAQGWFADVLLTPA